MNLDQDIIDRIIDRLEPPIQKVWDCIGPDAIEAFGDTNNEGAIELCLDANRLVTTAEDPNAEFLVLHLIDEHGYTKVLKFLAEHIDLV